MEQPSHPLIYDSIGVGYRRFRVPDQRIAAQIRAAIGPASTVCNVGAGTGSYEPIDLEVTAVEPSQRMIDQRGDSATVVRASAESLPFSDKQFDVAMAVLTVHHWSDQRKGLLEMQRVSRRQVILTFDPLRKNHFGWFGIIFQNFRNLTGGVPCRWRPTKKLSAAAWCHL